MNEDTLEIVLQVHISPSRGQAKKKKLSNDPGRIQVHVSNIMMDIRPLPASGRKHWQA
jgi:hypothetical protein